jgi:hypothetical protein
MSERESPEEFAKNYTLVTVLDVIGPLPSESGGMVVFKSPGKIFSMECCFGDVEACSQIKNGDSKHGENMYQFFVSAIKVMGQSAAVTTDICRRDGDPYSKVTWGSEGKPPFKVLSTNPMLAVNVSLAAGVGLYMQSSLVVERNDIGHEYKALKDTGILMPLVLDSTKTLEALSNLLDKCRSKV